MKHVSILVVEDEPTQRDRLVRALSACTHPWCVLGVEGSQALDYLLGRGSHAGREARKQPRLVLLGIDGDPGLELLYQIRVTPQTQALPVVHLIAPDTPRKVQDIWYKVGVNSLVSRTHDDEALRSKMQSLHDFWMTVNEADRNSRV